MAIVAVSRSLREKLGDDGVDGLIELFNKEGEKRKEEVIALSEEKFERKLAEGINGIRTDLAILEGKFEARITEETSKLDKQGFHLLKIK